MSSENSRKIKDALTLHLPLVIVLALCTVATVIEYGRAQEGVGRAWAYTFQWPIIGLFAIVIWNRYRKHGSLTRWFTDRYRNRIAAFAAEAEAAEAVKKPEPVDPDEQAWAEYVADLRRRDEHGQ
ncbi:MAG: hypothetical protein VW362_02540 [Candidatus Nanopelagicales bacterium]